MRPSRQHPKQNDYGHFCCLFSLSRMSRRGLSHFLLKVLAYPVRQSANSFGKDSRGKRIALQLDFHRHHRILGSLSMVMTLNEELQLLKLYQT